MIKASMLYATTNYSHILSGIIKARVVLNLTKPTYDGQAYGNGR